MTGLPPDPFGRPSRPPATFDRAGRVTLFGDAAIALLGLRAPSPEACAFLGGAILAYLQNGGDLVRDWLDITAPQGSRLTPQVLWRELGGDVIGDERQPNEAMEEFELSKEQDFE